MNNEKCEKCGITSDEDYDMCFYGNVKDVDGIMHSTLCEECTYE